MKFLSQQDPLWANKFLGQSKFTIGRYGCTTTCISMISDYFGCYQDPGMIAQMFVKYTMDGYILWDTLMLSRVAFESRLKNRDDVAIQAALRDPNRAVILNVNNGAHWVVALSKVTLANDYWILDAWDGKKKKASAYSNIVGSATFKLK